MPRVVTLVQICYALMLRPYVIMGKTRGIIMCDALTEKDNAKFAKAGGVLNRRDFSKLGTAATFAAMFPLAACSSESGSESITEKNVHVTTPDGVSDCYFVSPSKGKHPAVLMWPDIKGLRPAFKAMGKRLAMAGYAVLVVNPFYRDATAPVAGNAPDFSDPDTRKLLIGMARKLTQDASMSDARAYIKFLDAQASVDTSRKIGTAGYCMGGPLIMRTAAAVPQRVGAAASFHGGGLVHGGEDSPHLLIPKDTSRKIGTAGYCMGGPLIMRTAAAVPQRVGAAASFHGGGLVHGGEDSPHLLIPKSAAHVLHAIAENDDAKQPDAKTILAEAYKAAGTPAEIEVYTDTLHGWCPPDSKVYNEVQAEKAWARMLALFERALV